MEEIPENLVHDHEKNGLPRLSSLPPREITHRFGEYDLKKPNKYHTSCFYHFSFCLHFFLLLELEN